MLGSFGFTTSTAESTATFGFLIPKTFAKSTAFAVMRAFSGNVEEKLRIGTNNFTALLKTINESLTYLEVDVGKKEKQAQKDFLHLSQEFLKYSLKNHTHKEFQEQVKRYNFSSIDLNSKARHDKEHALDQHTSCTLEEINGEIIGSSTTTKTYSFYKMYQTLYHRLLVV